MLPPRRHRFDAAPDHAAPTAAISNDDDTTSDDPNPPTPLTPVILSLGTPSTMPTRQQKPRTNTDGLTNPDATSMALPVEIRHHGRGGTTPDDAAFQQHPR